MSWALDLFGFSGWDIGMDKIRISGISRINLGDYLSISRCLMISKRIAQGFPEFLDGFPLDVSGFDVESDDLPRLEREVATLQVRR